MDRNGPTALLRDMAGVDAVSYWPGGYTFNVRFAKSMMETEEDLERFAALTDTYFRLGGMQMQINTISAKTLRKAQQHPDHGILYGMQYVIPNYLPGEPESAAWGDAVTICPWQMYLTYGDKELLSEQFESMKKWIGYITNHTKDQYLWTGHWHFGDWCGLDAPVGSYKGSSREDFIGSAF